MSTVQDPILNLISSGRTIVYKKRELLIRPEEELTSIFYLEKGFVRIYSVSGAGKEFTLNIFKPNSFFPLLVILGGLENIYYYSALTECVVRLVPISGYLDYLKTNPSFLLDTTQKILRGLGSTLTRMEYLMLGNAHSRVAGSLLLLAKRFGEKNAEGNISIEICNTHQNIADLSGLARETTSLEIEKLEKAKIITTQNRVLKILNLEKLKEEALIYYEDKSLPFTY